MSSLPPPVPRRVTSNQPPPLPPRNNPSQRTLIASPPPKVNDSCKEPIPRGAAMAMPPPVPRRGKLIRAQTYHAEEEKSQQHISKDHHEKSQNREHLISQHGSEEVNQDQSSHVLDLNRRPPPRCSHSRSVSAGSVMRTEEGQIYEASFQKITTSNHHRASTLDSINLEDMRYTVRSNQAEHRTPPPLPMSTKPSQVSEKKSDLLENQDLPGSIDNSALLARPIIRHTRRSSRRGLQRNGSRRQPIVVSSTTASTQSSTSCHLANRSPQNTAEQHKKNTCEPVQANSQPAAPHDHKEIGEDVDNIDDMVIPLQRPCVGCAIYSFTSDHESDLCFKKGDMITIDAQVGTDWLRGRSAKRVGIFPASYIYVMGNQDKPELIRRGASGWRAIVRFDYPGTYAGSLTLCRGTEVRVEKSAEEGWYFGHIPSQHVEFEENPPTLIPTCSGLFPKTYVEIIEEGRINAVAIQDYESPRFSFRVGDVIEILAKVSPGSKLVGRISTHEGIFPRRTVIYDKAFETKLPIMPEGWRLSSRSTHAHNACTSQSPHQPPPVPSKHAGATPVNQFSPSPLPPPPPSYPTIDEDDSAHRDLVLPMADRIKARKNHNNENCTIS